MIEDIFTLKPENDEYPDLIPLYNKWSKRTCCMSVGNTKVPEWDDMVNYCKEHQEETLRFFLDLIKAREKAKKEGVREDMFVGFFLDVLDICFPNMFRYEGYVPSMMAQDAWKNVAELLLYALENPMNEDELETNNYNYETNDIQCPSMDEGQEKK